jgi:hypothetical protein
VLAQLVRTAAYSACGSALWALLPVIGQRQLGLGAAGVGLLMGCMGPARSRPASSSAACERAWAWKPDPRRVPGLRSAMLVAAFVRWPIAVYAALAWPGLVDVGDVHLQHGHADQRAAWVRARAVPARALRARTVRDRLGDLGRAVGPVRSHASRCRSRRR